MKPKRHCTSIVSVVSLLVGIEKKTWLISFFSRSWRSTTTRAVIAHYAPLLEGFWTNPLILVGKASSLSQTGYKAYSYSPWAMITFSYIHDANWLLSHVMTYVHMTPIGIYCHQVQYELHVLTLISPSSKQLHHSQYKFLWSVSGSELWQVYQLQWCLELWYSTVGGLLLWLLPLPRHVQPWS